MRSHNSRSTTLARPLAILCHRSTHAWYQSPQAYDHLGRKTISNDNYCTLYGVRAFDTSLACINDLTNDWNITEFLTSDVRSRKCELCECKRAVYLGLASTGRAFRCYVMYLVCGRHFDTLLLRTLQPACSLGNGTFRLI